MYFWLSLLFLIGFVSERIIFPALFGYYEAILGFSFLIAYVLFFGLKRNTILFGLLIAFVFELLAGYNFGSVILPFLLVVILLTLLENFVNFGFSFRKISDSVKAAFLGIPFLAVFILFFNFISKYLFQSYSDYLAIFSIRNFQLLIGAFVYLFAYLLVFKLIRE